MLRPNNKIASIAWDEFMAAELYADDFEPNSWVGVLLADRDNYPAVHDFLARTYTDLKFNPIMVYADSIKVTGHCLNMTHLITADPDIRESVLASIKQMPHADILTELFVTTFETYDLL